MKERSNIIEIWIMNLGKTYDFLINSKIIPNLPLSFLYENSDSFDIEPIPGIELTFWPKTRRFEAIYITLIEDSPNGMPVYTGELPQPLKSLKTQENIHSFFGSPIRANGPMQFPGPPIKKMGGWDFYIFDLYPNLDILLEVQYTETLDIEKIVFSLPDRES